MLPQIRPRSLNKRLLFQTFAFIRSKTGKKGRGDRSNNNNKNKLVRKLGESKGRIDKFAGKKVGEGNLAVNGTRLVAVRPPTNGRARQ